MIIRRKLPQTPKPPLLEDFKHDLFLWCDWHDQVCSTGYAWMYIDDDGDWCFGIEEVGSEGDFCAAVDDPDYEYDPDDDPNYDPRPYHPCSTYSIADYFFGCGYDYEKHEELPSNLPELSGVYGSSINAAISEWWAKREGEDLRGWKFLGKA